MIMFKNSPRIDIQGTLLSQDLSRKVRNEFTAHIRYAVTPVTE